MMTDVSNERPPENPPILIVPESPLDSMLSAGADQFPYANLLPPAMVKRRAVRAAKRKALLMLGATFALLIVVLLYTGLQQRAADAALAEAQSTLDEATAFKAKFAYVPSVYQAVTTARKELATAMGQEVQVSRLLTGLSAMQPPGLSLSTLQTAVSAGNAEASGRSTEVIPGVGAVTFDGEAKEMDDIAAWLSNVRLSADYSNPMLTDVTNSGDGVYTFSATADLTEQALSGRYLEATG